MRTRISHFEGYSVSNFDEIILGGATGGRQKTIKRPPIYPAWHTLTVMAWGRKGKLRISFDGETYEEEWRLDEGVNLEFKMMVRSLRIKPWKRSQSTEFFITAIGGNLR